MAIPLRALAAAEERVEAAEPAEVAHEDVERFGEIDVMHLRAAPAPAPAPRCAADAGFTVAIIGGTLLGIAEHLVGLRDLLELLLRLLVAVVAVGMVLHRQL